MLYEKLHSENKLLEVQGRYLNLKKIESFLKSFKLKNQLEILGYSVQNRPIYKCQIGTGKIKILMWSQMHGNESTTTKGLLDFMNFLQNDEAAIEILNEYTFHIIPMLNPDGAEIYTRENANKVDLNRDFQNLSQPESRLLMQYFKEVAPDYCFNLHDQRTIFGVGNTGKTATLSFLAPSFNEAKEYDDFRLQSVKIIMKMYKTLKFIIPEQIGRFDDGFNNNCVGDAFQSLQTPTILIEAGHYPEDYDREETRRLVFIALLSAFQKEEKVSIIEEDFLNYLKIPQNTTNFYDIIFRNVKISIDNSENITNIAVQFTEELKNDKIVFNAFIVKTGNLNDCFGHFEYHANEEKFSDLQFDISKLNVNANFYPD